MFWAIATGIVCGAGLFFLALIATLFISLIMTLLSLVKDKYNKYMVVIQYEKSAYKEVQAIINETKYIQRSKSIHQDDIELILEMDIKGEKSTFINRLSEVEHVKSVSLVNYRGGI